MKYEFPVRYLSSVFINAEDIEVKPALVSELTDKLKDYNLIPTTAREEGKDGYYERLAFINSDTGLLVVLLGNRFDVSISPIDETASNMNIFSDFIRISKSIFSVLLNYFERPCGRIASIQEGFIRSKTTLKESEEFTSKLFKFPPIYLEFLPFEWDWRSASIINRSFGELSEPTNTILRISKRSGNATIQTKAKEFKKDFDGIQIELDINTRPQNMTPRFGVAEVTSFFTACLSWHQDLSNQICEYLNLPVE